MCNLNHPVIDIRDDGIYMYFHPLPSTLPRIKILEEEVTEDDKDRDNNSEQEQCSNDNMV